MTVMVLMATSSRTGELVAPHKSTRKLQTQDPAPPRLSAPLARRTVLCLVAMEAAVLIHWEYYATNFLGFVQLACITMLLKRF